MAWVTRIKKNPMLTVAREGYVYTFVLILWDPEKIAVLVKRCTVE